MNINFTDKVILITGGSRGIGRTLVENFAHSGGKTYFTFANSVEEAERLCGTLSDQKLFARHLKADVKDQAAMQAVVDQIIKEQGKIDVLINNAGIVRDGLVLMMDKNNWDDVLATNVTGAFHAIKPVAKAMLKKRSGVILNMSSIAASKPGKGHANYAASKGAIESLTRALAAELGGRGIRVNCIAPGMIETEMSAEVRNMAGDKILESITLARYGTTQDIANAAMFLASDLANYITGEVVHVDGGIKG